MYKLIHYSIAAYFKVPVERIMEAQGGSDLLDCRDSVKVSNA